MPSRTSPYERGVVAASRAVGTALPSVDGYFHGLPEGWQSYPACRARASLLGSLASAGVLADLKGLPEALADHVRTLPRLEWIPEVAHVAIMLAVRDARFTGPDGEDAFVAWLQKLNGELLPDRSSIGPSRAVREFPSIWSGLHQGTLLDVLDAGPRHALLGGTHPEPLFPPLANRWRRHAVCGYLARAGAVQPRAVELGRVGEQTRIAIEWT